MATSQNQGAGPQSILFRLPDELKQHLVSFLRYPDLQRLRGTCRYFYYFPDKLEILNCWEYVEHDFRDNIGDPDALIQLGYARSDLNRLYECGPCVGCRRLVSVKRFSTLVAGGDCWWHEEAYGPRERLDRAWNTHPEFRKPEISTTYPGDPSPEGQYLNFLCEDCFLRCKMYPHMMWDETRWMESERSWVLRCWDCGHERRYLKATSIEPNKRQEKNGKCHECWQRDNKQWLEHKKKLAAKVQMKQKELDSLRQYQEWMDDIDSREQDVEEEPSRAELPSDWPEWEAYLTERINEEDPGEPGGWR